MAEPVALAALMIDAAIGWPDALYRRIGHPVGAFARIIGWGERHGNDPAASFARRRLLGAVTLLLVAGFAYGTAWIAAALVRHWLGDFAWLGLALLAFPGLAQRSLHDHVLPVARALAMRDLPRARTAVSMIVGRDVAALDAAGIARAAIESLAESFCDGIAAPLFWLLLLGVPGLWAYKAINTADSLIGHKEERWCAFGWAAARTDDVVNLIPARIAGLVICLAGPGGFRTMLRDAGKHASPNAGWPEAAMAGALGVRLAGPVAYDGVMVDKDWIGTGRSDASAADLQNALAIYRRACLLLWLIGGGIAWAL
jgi:adenosylcobinamide-phosphate synthase